MATRPRTAPRVENGPRAILAAHLKPLLPTSWRIITNEANTDTPNSTVVKISQQSFKRLPEAPQGAHLIEFVVAITTPYTDLAKAEDQLDDDMNAFIHALDELAGVAWSEATKVAVEGRGLGYDITLTIPSIKE